jgi:hypothetical protein
MAYTPREIKDRVAVGDDIFQVEDLGNNRIRLIPAPTHVSEPGTPINKALLQPIEDYLATGVVPVERTITAVGGLTGGGSLDSDITISLGAPGTLSGATSNSVTYDSHTHEIRVATQAEVEDETNNVSLMTPRGVAQAFRKRVVFAQVDPEELPYFATVTRVALNPTDFNTIKFTPLLGEDESDKWFSLIFPSLGEVVVGTPQYLLSESPLPLNPRELGFHCFSPENLLTLRGVNISHGITMFKQNIVNFIVTRREGQGPGEINDVYLHFRFTGLKLY